MNCISLKHAFVLSLVGAHTIYSNTFASPITANVIGSSVDGAGVAGAEYRSGYEWDDENEAQDGAFTDRVDVFYNVSEDTQFRMFFNRVNPGNSDADFTNVFFEPAFQMFDKNEDGFDGAILTGLTLAEGDNRPNQFRIVLTGTLPITNGFITHNSIFAHQFGDMARDGMRYEARFRLMQSVPALGDATHLGVEMFNNFGNVQEDSSFDDDMVHRAGPVMTGSLTERVGFQTGLLAGLSDNAPDMAAKFWLSYQY